MVSGIQVMPENCIANLKLTQNSQYMVESPLQVWDKANQGCFFESAHRVPFHSAICNIHLNQNWEKDCSVDRNLNSAFLITVIRTLKSYFYTLVNKKQMFINGFSSLYAMNKCTPSNFPLYKDRLLRFGQHIKTE